MRVAMAALVSGIVMIASALPIEAQNVSSPYAGLEQRRIKALSEQEVADLTEGRGMGLALAAELNGYPGPRHTADLADPLQLSAEQRAQTQAQLAAMTAETKAIGQRILGDEGALDRLFEDKTITRETLSDLTARIAAAQGDLRAAHLRYHLAMLEILSPAQVARYAVLRGYVVGGHGMHSTQ